MKKVLITLTTIAVCLAAGLRPVSAQVPQLINYQGRVVSNGTNFNGLGQFKFALVNGTGTQAYWNNSGSLMSTNEPTNAVSVAVVNGLYAVMLGDTNFPNMAAIPTTVFSNSDVRTRVWFNNGVDGFQRLSPDQRIGAVGYALMASTVPNNSITSGKLASNAVTATSIASGAITSNKLAIGAVTTANIADGTITGIKLGNSVITSNKIEPGAIHGAHLASNAVSVGNFRPDVFPYLRDLVPAWSPDWTNIVFGRCSPRCARVDIDGTEACTPAITLDGCESSISVREDTVGAKTVEILGNAPGGGTIELKHPSGISTVSVRASQFGTDGGQIVLRNRDGNPTIDLNGEIVSEGRASRISLYNGAGQSTLHIHGHADQFGGSAISVQVLEITGGSDLSENFDIQPVDGELTPGMVVSIDPANPGKLVTSSKAYDRTVAGVVSGAGGVKPGMLMGQRGTQADGAHPVALTGRVYCLVDAAHGAIQPGDLITTSATPGHGMKASDHGRAQGAILGKAMTALETGKGLVLVLVSLQ